MLLTCHAKDLSLIFVDTLVVFGLLSMLLQSKRTSKTSTVIFYHFVHILSTRIFLDPSYSPYTEVLEPLHQFILNYFSCSHCAENFHKMALESLKSVRTPEDTALWLWRAHNRANKRLSGRCFLN